MIDHEVAERFFGVIADGYDNTAAGFDTLAQKWRDLDQAKTYPERALQVWICLTKAECYRQVADDLRRSRSDRMEREADSHSAIAHLIPGIQRYATAHIRTGSFLEAVLSNDLKEACARADDKSKRLLFEICAYLYNEVTGECWGSPEKVQAWLEARES